MLGAYIFTIVILLMNWALFLITIFDLKSVFSKEWNFAICTNMIDLGGYYAKWDK